MADRITVYSRAGIPLAELNAVVNRSWQTRRDYEGARGELVISVADNKATRELLAFNNLLLVQSDLVEDFVGILWPPRSWDGGLITVQLFSVEQRFKFRLTNVNDELAGVGGAIFTSLLKIANAPEDTGISYLAADIDLSGDAITREYHFDNVMSAVNTLAGDLDMYWWVYPVLSGNTLKMYAEWQKERGTLFATPLMEGHNLGNVSVSEEGDIANEITVWGETDDWKNPLFATASDELSQGEYGLIQDGFSSLNSKHIPSCMRLAKAAIGTRKEPNLTITADITQPPFPRVGDTVTVMLVTVGFLGNVGMGGTLTMRVYSEAFSTKKTTMSVILKQVLDE